MFYLFSNIPKNYKKKNMEQPETWIDGMSREIFDFLKPERDIKEYLRLTAMHEHFWLQKR